MRTFGKVQKNSGAIVYCFYKETADCAQVIYEFPNFELLLIFNTEDSFNGIRMKYEDDILYFNSADMLALGIDPFDAANDSYDPKITLYSMNTTVRLSQLYKENAVYNGENCYRLRGYPGDDVLAAYFSGTSSSYTVSADDLRPNRTIRWSYNGVTYTSTRDECYEFFGDTWWFQSNNIPSDVLSTKWFQDTFGSVYSEYIEYLSFTTDAESMVRQYLDK